MIYTLKNINGIRITVNLQCMLSPIFNLNNSCTQVA